MSPISATHFLGNKLLKVCKKEFFSPSKNSDRKEKEKKRKKKASNANTKRNATAKPFAFYTNATKSFFHHS